MASQYSDLFSMVPQTNVDVYRFVFLIEVALRELFIEEFTLASGPKWYKKHLPSDLLLAYTESRKKEFAEPWTSHASLHPLYYLDFADLAKVIERGDNWHKILSTSFGNKRDVLVGDLQRLSALRNKVAHNRKATAEDVTLARSTCESFAHALGNRFAILVNRCTCILSIPEYLRALQGEIDRTYNACLQKEILLESSVWIEISTCWWFDESYLNTNLNPIVEYFCTAIQSYRDLPRSRGSGPAIERWLRESELENLFQSARACVKILLEVVKYA